MGTMTGNQTSVDVIIKVGLSVDEADTAKSLGLSVEEYAQRMVLMINDRANLYSGVSVLVPDRNSVFEIKEFNSGR